MQMPEQDALTLLKSDHDTVKELFAKFDSLGERAEKSKDSVVQQICRELTVHAQIEEEIFYPRVRRAGKEEKNEVLEGIEEHALIKELVAELEGMTSTEETFDPKVKVLKEQVEHHVEEEETEMFPDVRKTIDKDELVRLGEELAIAKQEAIASAAR
jgi:hemerythrin superfamily protein